MIVGIGSDIVNIKRIEKTINKFGKKFIKRCFSQVEILKSEKRMNKVASYAKRFAAKEACVKALGLGISRGVFWTDIAVENDIKGKPFIKLYGNANKRLKELCSKTCYIDVSLSDEKNYAISNILIHKQNEI